MHPSDGVIMLMYDPMPPTLMLIALVEVLESLNGERCGRSSGRGDVGREIFKVVTDSGFPCFDRRRVESGVLESTG